MQFEDFDKKVREAAEHHHPAYDEKAWNSMENLLDKHLPVEKDNRRKLLFLLALFLLAGTGAYLWMAKPWKPATVADSNRQTIAQPPIAVSEKNSNAADASNDNNITKKNKETAPVSQPPGSGTETNTTPYPVNKISDQKIIVDENESTIAADKIIKKENNQNLKKKATARKKETFAKAASFPKNTGTQAKHLKITAAETNDDKISDAEKPIVNKNIDNNIGDKDKIAVAPEPVVTTIADNNTDRTEKPLTTDSSVNKEEEKENVIKSEPPAEQKKLPKKNKSSFAITVSGGPDVSTVGLSSLGKMNCVIGAGLSYTYNQFTIRSGFYAVKKVYTASPDEYNPPLHSPPTYLNLTKIDGDCKVYEIPVTFSYNFGDTKTHSWFGAVGLSSFLMKKETYDYYYKDISGNPAKKTWSTQNNKHMFSVLNLSGGYEKKLNRSLSLMVEPYFKIPLEGIGYGNIQLNSMGALISMKIEPFTRRK